MVVFEGWMSIIQLSKTEFVVVDSGFSILSDCKVACHQRKCSEKDDLQVLIWDTQFIVWMDILLWQIQQLVVRSHRRKQRCWGRPPAEGRCSFQHRSQPPAAPAFETQTAKPDRRKTMRRKYFDTAFYTDRNIFTNHVLKGAGWERHFCNWIISYIVVGVRWRCKEPETIKILYKKKHMLQQVTQLVT